MCSGTSNIVNGCEECEETREEKKDKTNERTNERNKIKQYEHECSISYAVCMVEHFSTRNDAPKFCSFLQSSPSRWLAAPHPYYCSFISVAKIKQRVGIIDFGSKISIHQRRMWIGEFYAFPLDSHIDLFIYFFWLRWIHIRWSPEKRENQFHGPEGRTWTLVIWKYDNLLLR